MPLPFLSWTMSQATTSLKHFPVILQTSIICFLGSFLLLEFFLTLLISSCILQFFDTTRVTFVLLFVFVVISSWNSPLAHPLSGTTCFSSSYFKPSFIAPWRMSGLIQNQEREKPSHVHMTETRNRGISSLYYLLLSWLTGNFVRMPVVWVTACP